MAQLLQQFSLDGPFSLELHGSAVRENCSQEQRYLAGQPSGLVVGRNHQARLHAEALVADVLQFVSREHFKIEKHSGKWNLHALSPNPMWRLRGSSITEVQKGQLMPLADGDDILLFTGATDLTPE